MRTAVFFIALATVALSGCGGGNTTAGAAGRATFTIIWPKPSRLIPAASNSIRVEMLRNNVVVGSQLAARPTGGGPATVSFNDLPLTTLTARARAYPQADGTGVIQASGTVPVTTLSGKTVHFTLTMASTVATISLTAPALLVGQQAPMQVTARDASSAVVLLAASKLQWTSSDTAVVTVDGSGQVTGIATGTATVTVLDSESGKSGSVSVDVAPANIVLNSANGHYYGAVDTKTLISWSQAKTAAQALRYKGMAGHLVTLTSAAENSFVAAHFPGDSVKSYFAGGFQDLSAPDYSEPAGGWKWITGEPWAFTNWHGGEPNDAGSTSNVMNLYPDDSWNDAIDNDGHGFGYIVEFEP